MRVEKPGWIQHGTDERSSIYGIDIHPSNQKFATCGGDNTVKIWKMSVFSASKEPFLQLATLSNHENAVNCVRWSSNGRYLASGSDDMLVMIYELRASSAAPAVPFGSKQVPNVENWIRITTWRGHTMNVEDVAWSPDDRMLASCSIDNTVRIWDVDPAVIGTNNAQPLKVLSSHSSWVKGITWDPVGKYLASSAEDQSVIVWNVRDWSVEKKVQEPYKDGATSTYFRRISWSPDGMSICTTNGVKSNQNVAPLIDRTEWTNEVNLVGHRGPVSCTRFNSKLMVKKEGEKDFACCAVGGNDCTISIWLTAVSRPLAIVKDCFDNAVTDLSWSPCGYMLFSCSIDGTVCCFQFTPRELGVPLSVENQSRLLQEKFGLNAGSTATASSIVENTWQLQYEENKSIEKPTVKPEQTTVTVPKKPVNHVNVLQVVSKSKGGKKRISPVLLQGSQAPKKSTDSAVEAPVSNENATMNSSSVLLSSDQSSSTNENSSSNPTPPTPPRTQQTLKDTSSKTPPPKKPRLQGKSNSEQRTFNSPGAASLISVSSSKATPRVPKAKSRIFKRKDLGRNIIPPPIITMNLQTGFVDQKANRDVSLKAVVQNMELELDENELPIAATTVLGATAYTELCSIEDDQAVWQIRLRGRMTMLIANEHFTAAAMEGGSLFVFSRYGRRLLPCLELGQEVSILECSDPSSYFLLCISSMAEVNVWNMELLTNVFTCKLDDLLQSTDRIERRLVRARVSSTGEVWITVSERNADNQNQYLSSFTYHTTMKAWIRVSDDAFVSSDFYSLLPTMSSNIPSASKPGPVHRLQNASRVSRSSNDVARAMLSSLNPIMQRSITKTHLENELALAATLNSPHEYRHWLSCYVRYLSSDGDVDRLCELLRSFLGPSSNIYQDPTSRSGIPWQSKVLGMSKRRLLRSVILPVVAKNRNMQRIVSEYQSLLDDATMC